VTLGAHNLLSENERNSHQKIVSREFKIHPSWNPNLLLKNDVGLIKLPNPATLNSLHLDLTEINYFFVTDYSFNPTENVSTVCLVPSNIYIFFETMMNTTGWGNILDTSMVRYPVLRTVSLPTLSNKLCAATYGSDLINDGVICTSTTGRQGTCDVKSVLISYSYV